MLSIKSRFRENEHARRGALRGIVIIHYDLMGTHGVCVMTALDLAPVK